MYRNGYARRFSSVSDTTFSSLKVFTPVRRSNSASQLGMDEGSAYQSPPPPYLRRATRTLYSSAGSPFIT